MKKRIVTIHCLDCDDDFEITEIIENPSEPIDLMETRCPIYHPFGGGFNIKYESHRLEDFDMQKEVPGNHLDKFYGLPSILKSVPSNKEAIEAAEKMDAEIKAERQELAEQDRLEAEERLKVHLRQEFFATNEVGTEEDFERLYPSLRDEFLLDRSKRQPLSAPHQYLNQAYRQQKM
jgi:hypothetical protein